jgi:hypothetical protein
MRARFRLTTASIMGLFCLPLTYQLVARFRNLVEYWCHAVLKSVLPHFGANKKRKYPAINNLHSLSNRTFTLFPKSIQVVDWDRLVWSFLFEAAPKVRKIP